MASRLRIRCFDIALDTAVSVIYIYTEAGETYSLIMSKGTADMPGLESFTLKGKEPALL